MIKIIGSLPVPKIDNKALIMLPCHNWVCGRGLPGSPESLKMTCTECGEQVASPSHFHAARPCIMRLVPISWAGINSATYAIQHLLNENRALLIEIAALRVKLAEATP